MLPSCELLEQVEPGRWQREIASQRGALGDALHRHDIASQPSHAPWVLAAAPGLRERLAPQGVVVRDCASFGLPGHVGIAVPDRTGIDRLERALETTA